MNAEPKKIIHSLEENQTNTIDLSQKIVAPILDVAIEKETPKSSTEDKIVFELIEELEVVEPKMVSELIQTTDLIKNIDVTYEIVSPFSENHLFATTPEVREIIVKEPEFVIVEKEQVTLSFDLSIEKNVEAEVEKTVLFELDPIATNEIIVNEPKQVIPMTEVNETGVVRYSLEEYMEVESELLNSKPIVNVVEEPVNEEMNITMKKVETPSAFTPSFDEINPTAELTIEETLKMRADERRKKLKEFNYKFHNNSSRLDEMEKVPAYKRMGVDLPTNSPLNNQSRTSLGTDSNNDTQLRSNNSFLHDNVD